MKPIAATISEDDDDAGPQQVGLILPELFALEARPIDRATSAGGWGDALNSARPNGETNLRACWLINAATLILTRCHFGRGGIGGADVQPIPLPPS